MNNRKRKPIVHNTPPIMSKSGKLLFCASGEMPCPSLPPKLDVTVDESVGVEP
jgi:hypothetical protein